MSTGPGEGVQGAGPAPEAPKPTPPAAGVPADTDAREDGPEARRQALLRAGWAQGRVLPADLLAEVRRIPFAPEPAEHELAIVIMADCDTIQGDCAVEPAVEVAVARHVTTVRPELKALKNPRLLHIEAVDGTGRRQPIEVGVWSKGYIDRRLIADRQPDGDWTIPADAIDLIADLFSRRYLRATFPDCFMNRFASVAAKFDQIVKRRAGDITGIFLRVDPPDEERPADEDPDERPYEVQIYLTMSRALCADVKRRTQVESEIRKDLVETMRKCRGIEAGPVNLVDPLLITFGEMMETTEWDHEPLRAGIAAKAAERQAAGDPSPGSQGGRPDRRTVDGGRSPASPLD